MPSRRMSGASMRATLALALGALAATSALAATYDTTFTITLEPGKPPIVDAPVGMVRTARADDGETYAWDLTLLEDYTVGEIRVKGAFDVARARQLLPEYDDSAQHPDAEHLHPHFFTEVFRDVSDADGPARIVNFSGTGQDTRIRLGLTGPGNATLLLRRDTTPPAYHLDPPANFTTYSFLLTTRTEEFAYGDVRIRPAAGGDEVRTPTAVPALRQTFPVQGLDADTEYLAYVVFTDWSGNEARSPEFRVRTLPEPDRPRPRVLDVRPTPNSTANGTEPLVVVVDANGTLSASGVRLFLDLKPVPEGFDLQPDAIVPGRYVVSYPLPHALPPGRHRASIDIVNDAGGEGGARWSWEVLSADTPAVGVSAGLVALGLLAVAMRAERRRIPRQRT